MNQWSKPYTRRVTAVAPQQQLLLRQHQQIPRHQAYADHTSTIVNYPDRSGTGERIRNKLPTTKTKKKTLTHQHFIFIYMLSNTAYNSTTTANNNSDNNNKILVTLPKTNQCYAMLRNA